MPSILTDLGKTKLASATPLDQLNITEIAVGDGNGGYPPLLPAMTALTNEVWRGNTSAPIRDPDNANILIFEGFIPGGIGGFDIREMAIFDVAGDMIAIGHTTLVEKPAPGQDTGISLAVRLHVALESASQVDLIYQDDGFIDHQGLVNRDAEESHPASAISTEALSELDLPIADVQTVLNALKAAALHPVIGNAIDETLGALLKRGAWGLGGYLAIADANNAVRSGFYSLPVSLGAANAALPGISGSLIVVEGGAGEGYITQFWIKSNETAGKAVAFRNGYGNPITWDATWTFLWHDGNLKKADQATAQAGLNDTDFMTPLTTIQLLLANNEMTGAIMPFATTVPPSGWLKANGAEASRTVYAALFAKVGTFWGAGNGTTTFNLPDLRGEFIRGWDDGRGVDSGRSFGNVQQATKIGLVSGQYGNNLQGLTFSDGPDGTVSLNTATFGGSADTFTYYKMRPRNVSLLYYIKY